MIDRRQDFVSDSIDHRGRSRSFDPAPFAALFNRSANLRIVPSGATSPFGFAAVVGSDPHFGEPFGVGRHGVPAVGEADHGLRLTAIPPAGKDLRHAGTDRGQRDLVLPPRSNKLEVFGRKYVRDPAKSRKEVLDRSVVFEFGAVVSDHIESVPRPGRPEPTTRLVSFGTPAKEYLRTGRGLMAPARGRRMLPKIVRGAGRFHFQSRSNRYNAKVEMQHIRAFTLILCAARSGRLRGRRAVGTAPGRCGSTSGELAQPCPPPRLFGRRAHRFGWRRLPAGCTRWQRSWRSIRAS